MGQGNIIGKPNLPATTSARGVWNLREQNTANRAGLWPGYDPQWDKTTLLLKTALTDTFTDSSTNNHAVTRSGDASQTIFTPYEPTGYWSNYFDGSGDWLYSPSNAAFGLGSGSYTIEMWIFPHSWSSNYVPLIRNGSTTNGFSFSKGYNANTLIVNNIGVGDMITSNVLPEVGKWSHVAVVRDGTTLSIFINGVRTATTTNSVNHPTGDIYVGGYSDGVNSPFNGYISNVRLVKGTAVYAATFPARTTTQPSIVTSGLVAYYDSNNTNSYSGSGSTWTNLVAGGSAYNATISGATFDSSESGHFTFSGSNSVSLPSPVQDNMTLSCWFRTTSSAGSASQWYTGCALLSGEVGGITNDYGLGIGAGRVMFGTGNGDVSAVSPLAYNDGQWHYAVGVRTRSTGALQLYVDGALVATATGQTGSLTATTTVYMGKHPGESNGFVGNVAAALIYNTALTADQVTTNYNAIRTRFTAFTPPTAPLTAIANTSLLTCQDNRLRDNSTNNFTLTKNGDVAVSSFGPFAWTWSAASGGSGYFDGSGDYLTIPDNAALRMGTGDFTWEFWHFPTTFSGYYVTLIDKGYTAAGALLFQSNGADKLVIYASGSPVITSSISINPGSWHHIALVRNGTTLTLYINGVSAGSATNSTDFNSNSQMVVGANSAGAATLGQYPTYGYLSGVRVVKGIAVYTANFTPPTSPVTAVSGTSLLLNFDNVIGTNWHDTTTGLPIRAFGNPTRSTVVPHADYATSTYFNGSTDWLNIPTTPLCGMGAGDFTLECWFYKTTSNLDVLIDTRNGAGGNALGMALYVQSNTLKAGNDAERIAGGTITNNTWNHCAVVRSGNTLNLYLNGTRTNSVAWTTAAASSCSPLIGKSAANEYAGGFLAGVRILRSAAYTGTTYTVPVRPAAPTTDTALLLNQTPATWDATGRNALASTGTVVATPNMFTGSALSLNGSSQSVRLYSGTLAADFAFGTNPFTIEAWIFPTSTSGYRCIFSTRGSAATAVWFGLDINTYTPIYYHSGAVVSSNTTVPANAWSHVALVRVNGVAYIYVNGVCTGSGANTTNITDSSAGIGYAVSENTYWWIGQIDELRVTKAARYLGNFTPTTAPFDRDWEPAYNDTFVTSNVLQARSIDLAGATNNVFRDDSANNFTPVRYGDVTQGSFSPHIPSGYWSNFFDGNGDYLTLPSSAAFSFNADFTVEFWMRLSSVSTSTYPALIDFRGNGTNGAYIYIGLDNGNLILFTNSAVRIRSGSLNAATWYHVALVRSGMTTTLYLNGASVGAISDSTSYINNGISICANSQVISQCVDGYLSNLRLVKGTAVYTSNFTPPNAPLTAISGTSLLTCQDNRFIDRSTNNFTLTRNGDVSVSRFDPFPLTIPVTTVATINPGSVYFDGAGGDFLSAPNAAANVTNQNYTAEAWVWFNVNNVGYQPVFANAGTGDAHGWILITETNNYLYAYHSASGGAWNYNIATSYQPTVNTWTHLALVRNGTTITLYANGVSIGSTSIGTNSVQSPSNAFYLGYYPWFPGGARSLNGHISNFRMVIGTAVYTANFTVPTAPLTAITNTSLLLAQDANAITTDASANRYAITVGGDARGHDRYPFANPATKRATYAYGGSGYFDGTGDYLSVSSTNSGFSFGTSTDFTVECWVYPTSLPSEMCVLSSQGQGAGSFLIGLNSGGIAVGRPAVAYDYGAGTVVANTWNHIAVTRSAGTLRIFRNGVQEGSWSSSIDYNFGNGVLVGKFSNADWALFVGFIANVRIVKGTAVYTANFTPPTSPVTAISGTSLLLNFDNAGVYDATGQRNLLTLGSAATSTTKRKHEVASALMGGVSGHYIAPAGTPTGIVFGVGDFCIEFWLYRNTTATQVFYDQRPTSTDGVYPTIYCEGVTLYYYVAGGNRIAGTAIAAGQWYHIAVSRSSSQTRMFVDGVQVGATYADTNSYLCGTNRPAIGNNGAWGDAPFNGYIEGLRVSRVGRYVANFTVPSEPFPVA